MPESNPGEQTWAAPAAAGPLDTRVRVPGSKSLTNRAYVLAALSTESTHVLDPLDSRDTRLMLAALERLGASYAHTERGMRRQSR